MKVGELVTFTLPSSKKKMAGKILEVRDKKVVIQSKDGKKLIPKTLLTIKKKKAPPKITGEQMKSIKVLGVKGQIPKKVVKKTKERNELEVRNGAETVKNMTSSILIMYLKKTFKDRELVITSNQEEKIKRFYDTSDLGGIMIGDVKRTGRDREIENPNPNIRSKMVISEKIRLQYQVFDKFIQIEEKSLGANIFEEVPLMESWGVDFKYTDLGMASPEQFKKFYPKESVGTISKTNVNDESSSVYDIAVNKVVMKAKYVKNSKGMKSQEDRDREKREVMEKAKYTRQRIAEISKMGDPLYKVWEESGKRWKLKQNQRDIIMEALKNVSDRDKNRVVFQATGKTGKVKKLKIYIYQGTGEIHKLVPGGLIGLRKS